MRYNPVGVKGKKYGVAFYLDKLLIIHDEMSHSIYNDSKKIGNVYNNL